MTLDASVLRSRRNLLLGAIGGASALAATALGRPLPVRAGSTQVFTEVDNPSEDTTSITASGGVGLLGSTSSPIHSGLEGRNTNPTGGIGVSGVVLEEESTAVLGNATSDTGETYGCVGQVFSPNGAALMGWNLFRGIAVAGYSGTTDATVAGDVADCGVIGIAEATGALARGVIGRSVGGQGVRGEVTDAAGYGVFSSGKLGTNKQIELREMVAPPAPAANRVFLFSRDVAGTTQLCARFSNGVIRVIATM